MQTSWPQEVASQKGHNRPKGTTDPKATVIHAATARYAGLVDIKHSQLQAIDWFWRDIFFKWMTRLSYNPPRLVFHSCQQCKDSTSRKEARQGQAFACRAIPPRHEGWGFSRNLMNILRFSDLCTQGRVNGQRVFIRADLNVPLNDAGEITEDTRVRASVPAIEMALEAGAAVMVTSHLGRPTEGAFNSADSLAPVAQRLAHLLGREVPLIRNWVDGVQIVPGQVVLLENCRLNIGEKKNSEDLARKLAALCDIFVHDAFGTAHRAEGTTYGIAQFAPLACAGPLLSAEIDALTKALAQPKRPLVAIVAGSKVSTKLTILQSLAKNVDQLVVGGGIANTFMLAAGLPIGKSLAETDLVAQARTVMDAMAARGAQVPIPTDVVVAKTFAADAQATVKLASEVADDDMILDIGPETAARLTAQLKQAGTIVWNGPVGVFEFEQFSGGTQAIADAITQSSAFSIAGGGDTLAAIAKYGIEDKVGYISTGGGAFLEVLEGKTLPAFEILEKRARN